jgi:hypothetical protein
LAKAVYLYLKKRARKLPVSAGFVNQYSLQLPLYTARLVTWLANFQPAA